MRYRVRSRRAKVSRYTLDLDAIRRMDHWDRLEYVALRAALLATFGDRLEITEVFWRHEAGVPEYLRTLPPEPDPRPLIRGLPADLERFEDQRTTHAAILAGRLAWLADHPLEEGDTDG